MKILVNGELKFEGTEKEVLKFAKSLANERRKSEVGKVIEKEQRKPCYKYWKDGSNLYEGIKEKANVNWLPLKIEFLN